MLNTWYRLSDEPLQLVWGFLWAVLGGWLGMGYHVWSVFRTQAIFSQQRIANTLAMGLLFGFFLGITTLMGHTFPYRLRRFWSTWMRLVWSAISAYFLSQLLWWSYVWMYLNLDLLTRHYGDRGRGNGVRFDLAHRVTDAWMAFIHHHHPCHLWGVIHCL
ncbi:MAG UNVERIFIED_CONTAM: hypothetical protein LVT10_16600 [Anaerolineae bacterium]